MKFLYHNLLAIGLNVLFVGFVPLDSKIANFCYGFVVLMSTWETRKAMQRNDLYSYISNRKRSIPHVYTPWFHLFLHFSPLHLAINIYGLTISYLTYSEKFDKLDQVLRGALLAHLGFHLIHNIVETVINDRYNISRQHVFGTSVSLSATATILLLKCKSVDPTKFFWVNPTTLIVVHVLADLILRYNFRVRLLNRYNYFSVLAHGFGVVFGIGWFYHESLFQINISS